MCDMLLKCESLDMFMYPTLETLTEISEDGVSSGVKTPRSVLVLNEDNNNKSRIFENFSSITTPVDSPSVISFQMNGEHQTSSRSSRKSQNETNQENDVNRETFHCIPDETKSPDITNQVESAKQMNFQQNVELNNEEKINTEFNQQIQNDILINSDTLRENSAPGNNEALIVKQILRSPSDAPSFYTSDSTKSPSISSMSHDKLVTNYNDESRPQITTVISGSPPQITTVISGQNNNYQLLQNSPKYPDNAPQRSEMSLESNGINLNSDIYQQLVNVHETVETIKEIINTPPLRSANPFEPSQKQLSGNSSPTSSVVTKTVSPATSQHTFSSSVQSITVSPSLSMKHSEEDIPCLRLTSAQSNKSVTDENLNKSNSEVISQKPIKSRSSSGKSSSPEMLNNKTIKSAPPSAKSNKSRVSDKSVNSPSVEKNRWSHLVGTEAQVDSNIMCYQNIINNENSEINNVEKRQSPIRIASSLIATPVSKNDSAISPPVSTPDSCMQELVISS